MVISTAIIGVISTLNLQIGFVNFQYTQKDTHPDSLFPGFCLNPKSSTLG